MKSKEFSTLTQDSLLGGQIHITQPQQGHRVGTDAILLAASVTPAQNAVVYDLGAGVGGISLCVGNRCPNCTFVGVEWDQDIAQLFEQNLKANQLSGQAVVLDVNAGKTAWQKAQLQPCSADVLLSNPPYNDLSLQASPNATKQAAHKIGQDLFLPWLELAYWLAKPKAMLSMIVRAQNLHDLLNAYDRKFGSIKILPIHSKQDQNAKLMIVQGIKGGKAPLQLLPQLVLHNSDGSFTHQAQSLHKGTTHLFDLFMQS